MSVSTLRKSNTLDKLLHKFNQKVLLKKRNPMWMKGCGNQN